MLVGTKRQGETMVALALANTPSLVIDCANIADPHQYFPAYDEEQLRSTYVMEIDLLYTFRDTIQRLETVCPDAVDFITITSPQHLFDYGDAVENRHVLRHTFSLLRERAQRYTIIVDVPSKYESMARRYCDVWGIPRAVRAKQ